MGTFEITTNAFKSSNMAFGRIEGVTGALVAGKGNVRTSVARKIKEHTNDACVGYNGICRFIGGVF